MTGPYYDKNTNIKGPPIERINYIVPSGYWKIITIKEGKDIKAVSFIFSQNTPMRDHYCNHLANIPDIEQKTGLRFFGGELTLKDSALKKKIGCSLNRHLAKETPKKYKGN